MAAPICTAHQSAATLQVELIPTHKLESYLTSRNRYLMGLIDYGGITPAPSPRAIPSLFVNLPQLSNNLVTEVWTSSTPTLQGEYGNVQYTKNEEVLFGCLQYKTRHEHTLEKDTQKTYLNILNLLESQGYPHLLRMWNYFPRINDFEGSLERYQQFCAGRFVAFQEKYGDNFNSKLPAASAIGTRAPGLFIYFIASRESGKHIENPRQVSAYHYPEQYGACSPSFARATHKKYGAMQYLYISGTASIVGHQTLHCGDIQKQTEETLENINKLLRYAVGANHKKRSSFDMVKIYLRKAEHQNLVEPILKKNFGHNTPLLYVEGDICRSDLLVEIEGACSIHQS